MEQVAEPEPLEQEGGPDRRRPLVFLDTNVIIGYLHGNLSAAQLFSAEADGRVRFAVSPIVLQELLLAADALVDRSSNEFETNREFCQWILEKLKHCSREHGL
jgi:predicted nucleic acid-binding protein